MSLDQRNVTREWYYIDNWAIGDAFIVTVAHRELKWRFLNEFLSPRKMGPSGGYLEWISEYRRTSDQLSSWKATRNEILCSMPKLAKFGPSALPDDYFKCESFYTVTPCLSLWDRYLGNVPKMWFGVVLCLAFFGAAGLWLVHLPEAPNSEKNVSLPPLCGPFSSIYGSWVSKALLRTFGQRDVDFPTSLSAVTKPLRIAILPCGTNKSPFFRRFVLLLFLFYQTYRKLEHKSNLNFTEDANVFRYVSFLRSCFFFVGPDFLVVPCCPARISFSKDNVRLYPFSVSTFVLLAEFAALWCLRRLLWQLSH